MALHSRKQLGNVRRRHWSCWLWSTRRISCMRWHQHRRTCISPTTPSSAPWNQNETNRQNHRWHQNNTKRGCGNIRNTNTRLGNTLLGSDCHHFISIVGCIVPAGCYLSISLPRQPSQAIHALEQPATPKVTYTIESSSCNAIVCHNKANVNRYTNYASLSSAKLWGACPAAACQATLTIMWPIDFLTGRKTPLFWIFLFRSW